MKRPIDATRSVLPPTSAPISHVDRRARRGRSENGYTPPGPASQGSKPCAETEIWSESASRLGRDDEGSWRRKRPQGKQLEAFSNALGRSVSLRGRSKRVDEQAVGVAKGPTRLLRRRVKQGCGSLFEAMRSLMGILPRCTFGSQDLTVAFIQPSGSFAFDGTNELFNSGPVGVRSEVAPARQRC